MFEDCGLSILVNCFRTFKGKKSIVERLKSAYADDTTINVPLLVEFLKKDFFERDSFLDKKYKEITTKKVPYKAVQTAFKSLLEWNRDVWNSVYKLTLPSGEELYIDDDYVLGYDNPFKKNNIFEIEMYLNADDTRKEVAIRKSFKFKTPLDYLDNPILVSEAADKIGASKAEFGWTMSDWRDESEDGYRRGGHFKRTLDADQVADVYIQQFGYGEAKAKMQKDFEEQINQIQKRVVMIDSDKFGFTIDDDYDRNRDLEELPDDEILK